MQIFTLLLLQKFGTYGIISVEVISVPTGKPRVTITMTEEEFQQIETYRFETRQKNQTQAILSLLRTGLDSMTEDMKKAPSVSDEAVEFGKRYEALDKHGKVVVSVVMTEEEKRMKEEKKKARTKKYDGKATGEESPRMIPLYLNPPAAGYASPAFGEDFEYIEVGGDVPAHADFAVRIDGDSMEPYIMDGSTVYVNRDPLANGDVGIFFYDGDMLCKQYYRDEWGNVHLLSLNRAREDADRFIPEDSELVLICQGRVILPFPLNLAVPEKDLL